MNIKRVFTLLVLFSVTLLSNAQITVSGIVTASDSQEPLIGATIQIKGTTLGTTTDINGRYNIEVPSDGILVFSYMGYVSEEVDVNNRNVIDITLQTSVEDISEIVVVGYGTQKKADLTSAIATLSPKEILKMPGNVTSGMQGSIAGVNVTAGKVWIRGVSSVRNTDPLWVVDGLIDGMVPNENEIESIQVLKDAASCAIYGSRGANGVIIVTTKKGKAGAPKIEYNGYTGTKYPWRTIDMMEAVEFGEYVNECYYNYYYNPADPGALLPTPPAYEDPYHPLAETDWQDAWFRHGWYQNHNLSVSGGNENSSYRAGVNYSNDIGTVIRSSSNNIGLFLNSQFKKRLFNIILPSVSFGESFTLGKYTSESGGGGYFDLLRTPPNLPIYNAAEEYGYYITGTDSTGNDMINQIAMKNLTDNSNEYLNVKGTVWGEVEIIKNLKYKLNIGVDLYRGYTYTYVHVYSIGKGQNPLADLSESSTRNNRYLFEHTLTYETTIADAHNIIALYGITSETYKSRIIGAGGEDFPSGEARVLSSALTNKTINGREVERAQYSHLARIGYAYKGKYLFTGNMRMDATSRFSEVNRYAYFPSISVGWRISEEQFLKNSMPWLTNLKLRGSYGIVGNQSAIDDYGYESTIVTANQFYTFGPDQTNAFAPIPKVFNDPSLKWETSYQADAGIDLNLFNDLIDLVIDYYYKKTVDMLVQVPIPSSTGSTEAPYINTGEVLNKGLEISLKHRYRINKFSYNIGANISFNKNEVLKLGDQDTPINAGQVSNNEYVTRTAVGSSIGRFYTRKTDGIFKSQEEVNNYTWTNPETNATNLIQPNAKPGDIKFLDLDDDGQITDEDKDWAGSPLPLFTYGFTVDFNWNGFDFSMLWQGDYGNKIFNNGISLVAHGTSAVNQTETIVDRFRENDVTIISNTGVEIRLPANTDTDIPRTVMNDPNGNFSKMSDYFVEDGSYLRLKRITLGYTFPVRWMSRIKVDNLRLYIGSKNLLTFTDYSFFDPEVVGLNEEGGYNVTRGIDMQKSWATGNLNAREFFVGLQLAF
ncbi:MAG: TonB-dependent receptor [Bacteroidales bacterium]|nr:TonB-dependent receptor [Bacteroidales bacterium]